MLVLLFTEQPAKFMLGAPLSVNDAVPTELPLPRVSRHELSCTIRAVALSGNGDRREAEAARERSRQLRIGRPGKRAVAVRRECRTKGAAWLVTLWPLSVLVATAFLSFGSLFWTPERTAESIAACNSVLLSIAVE